MPSSNNVVIGRIPVAGTKGKGKGKGRQQELQPQWGTQGANPMHELMRLLQGIAQGGGAGQWQETAAGVNSGRQEAVGPTGWEESAYDRWAKEKEQEAQTERDHYVERIVERRSASDAKNGR